MKRYGHAKPLKMLAVLQALEQFCKHSSRRLRRLSTRPGAPAAGGGGSGVGCPYNLAACDPAGALSEFSMVLDQVRAPARGPACDSDGRGERRREEHT